MEGVSKVDEGRLLEGTVLTIAMNGSSPPIATSSPSCEKAV